MNNVITVTSLIGGWPDTLQAQHNSGGCLSIDFEAEPGLYQFSAMVDGADFDWESLYVHLTKFHNHGERTGPWDFEVGEGDRALVPSFWVSVDGERLGLWYFQRISLIDLEARRFRGRTAFHLFRGGSHRLQLEPLGETRLPWLSCCLEDDPEETIDPWPEGLSKTGNDAPLAAWSQPGFWEEQRTLLAGECQMYAAALREACEWAATREPNPDLRHSMEHDIPLLVASEHLGYRAGGIAEALARVDAIIALDHWGNPRPDAYGHDGDMGAGLQLMTMSMAYHILGDHLGEPRRQRLLAKLELQGQRFFRLLLINRDYWGGSMLQDHGRRSVSIFTVAALQLLGLVPEAQLWVRMLLPRLRRNIDAQPLDGHVPPSSYHSTYLYLQELMLAVWTLTAMGGPDLTDHPSMRQIPRFIWSLLPAAERKQLSTSSQLHVQLDGGTSLFNWLAARHGDPEAAALHRLFIQANAVPARGNMLHHSRFWSFFMHRKLAPPVALASAPARQLQLCQDSARVFFQDETRGLRFAAQGGPWCGYNAYRRASGPCDRMRMEVASGTFQLSIGGKILLSHAPTGYYMHTAAGSTWLVDDTGQRGDIGYPMSIPSCPHWGEEFTACRWDEATGSGWVELNLQPAYPEQLGMIRGTRRFVFTPGEVLRIVDHLLFATPRKVSWLFQTDSLNSPRLDDLTATIGDGLTLTPHVAGDCRLQAAIHSSFQVHSYSSSFADYVHVRYDSLPCRELTVAFSLNHSR